MAPFVHAHAGISNQAGFHIHGLAVASHQDHDLALRDRGDLVGDEVSLAATLPRNETSSDLVEPGRIEIAAAPPRDLAQRSQIIRAKEPAPQRPHPTSPPYRTQGYPPPQLAPPAPSI
ncbi:MAG: hypothetical protein FGM18_02215 [Burkholderiaceae bacterium]|nr:hypothetical protein [Burkholderiaceae bacterium]